MGVLNKQLLIAELNDKSLQRDLLGEASAEFIKKYKALSYGHSTLIAYNWFMQKANTDSSDLRQILQETQQQKSLVIKLHNLLKKDMVISETVTNPVLYGCNIIVPPSYVFKRADISLAVDLFLDKHPICDYLSKIVRKWRTVNIFEIKFLEELIDYIDFPIPSISAMLETLGYTFIYDNPFEAQGIILGVLDEADRVCVYYGPKYKQFKCMDYSTFADLVANSILTQPMEAFDAVSMLIETNHYIK